MPKFMEENLEKEASKKGFTGKRKNAYVYGTMNKMGFMKGNKTTAKGRRAEKKHYRSLGG